MGPHPCRQEPTRRVGSPCSDQCTWEETLAAEPRAQGGRLARGQHPDSEQLIGPPSPTAAPRWLDHLLQSSFVHSSAGAAEKGGGGTSVPRGSDHGEQRSRAPDMPSRGQVHRRAGASWGASRSLAGSPRGSAGAGSLRAVARSSQDAPWAEPMTLQDHSCPTRTCLSHKCNESRVKGWKRMRHTNTKWQPQEGGGGHTHS